MRPPGRVGELVNPDGTWVVGDPLEEEEERKEREMIKRGYIEEAMKKKAEDGRKGAPNPDAGGVNPIDQMD